jgi:ATP-dependent helicase HepA
MSIFVPGQRWVIDTELDQGIGTVTNIKNRVVILYFPATDKTRNYSITNSPLTRVSFHPGDNIESYQGWSATVISVEEIDGLYIYKVDKEGTITSLHESKIANHLKLAHAQDRLLTGSIDPFKCFPLRYKTLVNNHVLKKSKFRGLLGPRTGLLSHQLRLVTEVANRHAPRVMLADEVGLGKTIEAGLILHQQLITERASRILIIVPDSLLHQWIVEMLRKFNLAFKLFDEERCVNTNCDNPFDSEQLIICTLSFICDFPNRSKQIIDSNFDIMVIDEAHHLVFEEEPNCYFKTIEPLAQTIPGLLLLTATPDQKGHKSHFERLKLIDHNRFSDFNSFLQQEKNYKQIADIALDIKNHSTISNEFSQYLLTFLGEDYQEDISNFNKLSSDSLEQQKLGNKLIQAIIDRHGTSRVLFRNTRESTGGFPKRLVQDYPQQLPELYQLATSKADNLEQLLYPEVCYFKQIETLLPDEAIPWWKIDPRIVWLIDALKILINRKVLLICAKASTAMEIQSALKILSGISTSVFHEGMTIVERDRAAAWFAEEDGIQALICSEIGSEGRNFQFVHDLILFDLPIIPDQLEQRIGRLDRIGQQHNIKIHVPYLQGHAQELLFKWYNDGLNSFSQVSATAMMVYNQQEKYLKELISLENIDNDGFKKLIDESKKLSYNYKIELQQGKDKLLELNYKGLGSTDSIEKQIQNEESPVALLQYAEQLFDNMGVELEQHSKDCFIVMSPEYISSPLPSVIKDTLTLTTDRKLALSRDDIEFLTWEHPIIIEGMESIINSEVGNTSVALLPNTSIPSGTIMLEVIFVLETVANKNLQLDRYLPATPIRCLIDPSYKTIEKIKFDSLDKKLKSIDKNMARKLAKRSSDKIIKMIKKAEEHANAKVEDIINNSYNTFTNDIANSLNRLQYLRKINPSVRQDEIDYLENIINEGQKAIKQARLRLDSLRVIITA